MQELNDLVNWANKFAEALQTGFSKFMLSYPVIMSQQLKSIASRKLNSTRESYINAIQTKIVMESVLVIELDKDAWLANAVEKGIAPYNMKETHLQSPKAKVSKEGFRYMIIPLGKDKSGGSASSSPKSQALREKIRAVLVKPQYGGKKMKQNMDGSVSTTEAVISNDPDIKGLHRVRQFQDSTQAASGQGGKTSFVLFRVMSEKPGTSTWDHPGIKATNAFRDLERFVAQTSGQMLMDMINTEISKI
jgi:hypothetical protein